MERKNKHFCIKQIHKFNAKRSHFYFSEIPDPLLNEHKLWHLYHDKRKRAM